MSACSPEGGSPAKSAACKAAVAANGAPFTAWDNLRVAGVNGRDRQVVPDGQLCSGGLAAYKGLDLARGDWPSTRLKPGATLELTYRSTIPHTGSFKLYLTKPGYDPAEPLKWSDLADKPFATVTDPPLENGSYHFSAKLPSDRSGHHVLYTIWQNTSTVDTYYSCSDVVFPAAKQGDAQGDSQAGSGNGSQDDSGDAKKSSGESSVEGSSSAEGSSGTAPATKTPSADGATASTVGTQADGARATVPGSPVASTSDGTGLSVPLLAGGAAALVLTAGTALALRRRGRRSRSH
ncbi:hypothetical protein SGFS_033790 [Streptomyces graminofaciens]|uniref:Chitin-binding type-4 domain-containing protein n=1 Tax=Streptomyces graminofaciens TaxID=68212 RepID=A0ABM7F7Z6_9ACTN|nr:hypothetical protein SGFS_033790 [Streptomyces graminofaciens]